MNISDEKSDLVRAIEARERKAWTFDIETFLARGGPKGKYRMRVLTTWEQGAAVLQAQQFCQKAAKDDLNSAQDPDFLDNVKLAYLIHTACLHETATRPAFPSAEWLLKHLSRDELAVMLNHYQEILRLSGPIDLDLTDSKIEGLAALCARHRDNDAPIMALMQLTREQIGEVAVQFAMKLGEARKPNETE